MSIGIVAFHLTMSPAGLGGSYLEQTNKDQLRRYFLKRLQRLGLTVTVEPAA